MAHANAAPGNVPPRLAWKTASCLEGVNRSVIRESGPAPRPRGAVERELMQVSFRPKRSGQSFAPHERVAVARPRFCA